MKGYGRVVIDRSGLMWKEFDRPKVKHGAKQLVTIYWPSSGPPHVMYGLVPKEHRPVSHGVLFHPMNANRARQQSPTELQTPKRSPATERRKGRS